MTPLLALLCAWAAPGIDVTLAPDQPVPFIYVDDPLIVQFKSDADVTVTGRVEFTGDDEQISAVELPAIPLRSGGTYWHPLEKAPAQRGRYRTHVVLDAGGALIEAHLIFCRIDRPEPAVTASLCVRVADQESRILQALQGIPVRQIELDAAEPGAALFVPAAAKAGCQVTFYADASRLEQGEGTLETLSKGLGEEIAGWAIRADGAPSSLDALVTAVRRGGSRAPAAVVVDSPEAFPPYLANGMGRGVSAVVLRQDAPEPAAVGALRLMAERAGYEGFLVHVSGTGVASAEAHVGARLVRQMMLVWAAGAQHCDLDPTYIYDGNGLGPAYVYLSAMIRRLNGGAFVGDLDVAAPVHALVFRVGTGWTLAAWTTGDPAEVTLPVGGASDLTCNDDRNNPLPVPEIEDGTVRLPLSEEPVYLSGAGGDVLAAAARNQAVREGKWFTGAKELREGLPPELSDLVKTVATSKTGRTERLNFFGLLRMFPYLEQQWHDGQIRKDVAVPAMASISRLVRSLCILEQEANETFIELLQETLARCGEYQSQYLTSTGGAGEAHERADWLSGEVGRLMAEAKSLSEQGRDIEAVGVASLAEWRARALEFAMRAAPLSEPEPEPPPAKTDEDKRGKSGRPAKKK